MEVKITPNRLSGTMKMPPSKSYGHRALICAALGGGTAEGAGCSEDIKATMRCLEAIENRQPLFANESGSTLRFMIPIALAVNGFCEISGSERLMHRPLDEYFAIFDEKGIKYSLNGNTLTVRGKLTGGEYTLRGDVSSQFITGLLFALPIIEDDSEIVLSTALESKAYVDMTIDVQQKFGVKIEKTLNGYRIKGGQKYKNVTYTVEGDFSQAAFFLAMGHINLTGLDKNSIQGDKAIVDIYREMGMVISETPAGYETDGRTTKNITVDVSQIPDTVPALACLMAVTEGEGRIVNAARLRIKECDRLEAVSTELKTLGADIFEGEDYLIIKGRKRLTGGVCSSHNDHRIAMAIASVTPYCDGDVIIKGAESVRKSMPDFWERFRALGGVADELDVGR